MPNIPSPIIVAVKILITASSDVCGTIWPLLESGEIAPVIHATVPLTEAAEAHRLLEEGAHIGKVVLVT